MLLTFLAGGVHSQLLIYGGASIGGRSCSICNGSDAGTVVCMPAL